MADIGRVMPGFNEGEATAIWRCPIEVFELGGKQLKVKSIYVDEGVLCMTSRTWRNSGKLCTR